LALASPLAHLASRDPASQVARLQGLADWPVEHVPRLDSGQPERELVGEVVAGAPRPVALDEGGRPEVLEARAGRGERLTPTFCSSGRVHGKAISKPQGLPILWAVRYVHILAVHCNHICLHLADNTPRYKLRNGVLSNRHHRNWFIGGQPVGLVVSARVVAHVVEVTEKERHCVELCHTRASTSKVLMVGLLVALDVEEGVAVPHLGLSGRTQGDRGRLTVPDQHVSRLINQVG